MNTTADLLRAIYQRDGKLTPAQVLREAESDESPLHAVFEWDDTIAAHRYRLEQAGDLIRSVKVRIMDREVRRFAFVTSSDSYHPIENVIGDRDWKAEIIAEFQRDAARFEARWANHVHLADHFQEWRTTI